MSYRSFKHVLGETSLERKCRFLFGACLLLLITSSFLWYGKQTEQLVIKQNRTKGRLLVDTIMTRTHWMGMANSPEELAMRKVIVPSIGGELEGNKYNWSFLNTARDGGSPQDEFEWTVYNRFVNSPPPADGSLPDVESDYAERFSPDMRMYQYYMPIRAKKICLITCHLPPPQRVGSTGQQLSIGGTGLVQGRQPVAGDVLAIVRVGIDNLPMQRELNWNRAILLTTAIITVSLAMLAAYIIVRYVIVKPLKHLRDVSDAISHGNIELRAEIRTADEFEELGVAFNRMLRHLVAIQEELRQVNVDLDVKVDQLAQANMRLFEMNRLKGDFLATMSHELRTPLNSIIGFSDVLGSIKSLDDKQKRYVQNIQKSGKMLLDMINDILDLAKIESGKMEMRLTDFRIEHVLAAQGDMARPLSEKKNIDLETQVEPGLPELHQDQGKVQQILNNLLSNAIKFTPEGGRIIVSARRAGRDLELVVSDTGVGISEEDQATIFEKFRQGKTVLAGGDAMTREFSGTGLGLSIVKELCRLLDGEITLESELGKGSTFTVHLPWSLSDRPKLDSPLAQTLEELTKGRRLDYDFPLARTNP